MEEYLGSPLDTNEIGDTFEDLLEGENSPALPMMNAGQAKIYVDEIIGRLYPGSNVAVKPSYIEWLFRLKHAQHPEVRNGLAATGQRSLSYTTCANDSYLGFPASTQSYRS